MFERLHRQLIFPRRSRRLAAIFSNILPTDAVVLDVGCGDGLIDKLLLGKRPDLQIHGIDPLIRPTCHIPTKTFDGKTIPFPEDSFDVVMLVDVLHHTDDPIFLLREVKRVARLGILLKDHTLQGPLAEATLRIMDWVGNASHGIPLPYHFYTETEWRNVFQDLELIPVRFLKNLRLYAPPLSWWFDRSLHFVAYLQKHARRSAPSPTDGLEGR